MKARSIAAVLFDCDGVLVDSESLSCASLGELLTRHGVPMVEADVRARFLGRSIDAVIEHCRGLGVELPPTFVAEKERAYVERARGVVKEIPGARSVVEALGARLHVAVVTSGTPAKVAFSLEETGLAGVFARVFTSSEVTRGKPFPDLFLHAARALEVEPRACVVVEDSPSGVAAGRAAEMHVVGLTSSLSRAALLEAGAHLAIDHLDELLALPELACAPA